ncbi:unnamed protein product [Linum trigynum]|uniref:Uncharacterized protein n=1 Tax=Linum trigynum TaxID=586398 RepID=A0AAV2CT91_9ROSI
MNKLQKKKIELQLKKRRIETLDSALPLSASSDLEDLRLHPSLASVEALSFTTTATVSATQNRVPRGRPASNLTDVATLFHARYRHSSLSVLDSSSSTANQDGGGEGGVLRRSNPGTLQCRSRFSSAASLLLLLVVLHQREIKMVLRRRWLLEPVWSTYFHSRQKI